MEKYILAALGAAAMVASISSCKKSAQDQETETPVIEVRQVIEKDVALRFSYPGYLTANQAVDAVARVSGQVLTQNYASGARVEKGDVLFTIDDGPYRDAVAQAQAALCTATSTYDYAKAHYEAVKKASESDAVSKMEVVQAESDFKQSEAAIKNARAALETANRNLGYCIVRAPISGEASNNKIDVGSYVGGGASPVVAATIYDNSMMTANFSIEDERYLDILKSKAARDTLDFDAVPVSFSETLPHSYTSRVSYMAPAMNQSTGTMALQCKIDNPYDELRAGMFVEIHLPYGTRTHAILVNDASIASDQLGKYMYVVNDSNKVVYTPVTVGELVDDTLRIIDSGLTPGTKYVSKALLKVRDGEKVTPRLVEY